MDHFNVKNDQIEGTVGSNNKISNSSHFDVFNIQEEVQYIVQYIAY